MLSQVPEDSLVMEALRDRSGEDCWSERTAELLRGWGEQWDRAAAYHAKWSQLCALSHFALAGPAVVLPLVFQEALPEPTLRVGFLCCSLLAALLSFLNFNALSAKSPPGGFYLLPFTFPAPPAHSARCRRRQAADQTSRAFGRCGRAPGPP
jgi:hypothetical protein